MRLITLAGICLFLVSCQSTSKTFPSGLSNYLEWNYLDIDDGKDRYKAFAAAINNSANGWVSKNEAGSDDIYALIDKLLKVCNEERRKYGIYKKCRITHLGNTPIFYSSDSELNTLANDYIIRMDNAPTGLALWSNKQLCSYAYNKEKNLWNSAYEAAIDEARKRKLDCKNVSTAPLEKRYSLYSKNDDTTDVKTLGPINAMHLRKEKSDDAKFGAVVTSRTLEYNAKEEFFIGSSNKSAFGLVYLLLEKCKNKPLTKNCRVTHLGKEQIRYSSEKDLIHLIEKYVEEQAALPPAS